MFGPDKCGNSNARTHVIFTYPSTDEVSNLLIKKDVKMEKDQASHLYTLHVKPDATFEVQFFNTWTSYPFWFDFFGIIILPRKMYSIA